MGTTKNVLKREDFKSLRECVVSFRVKRRDKRKTIKENSWSCGSDSRRRNGSNTQV